MYMRIAMISTPFLSVPPRDYGGTELVVFELVEGLTARGHDVTLFATGDSSTSATLRAFFPKPQWPPDPYTDANHISWAMAEIFADGAFDVIHAHSALALPSCRLRPDLPLVYTLHHAREEILSAFYQNFSEAFYVAISENQKRLEIPLRHCEVIYHGLDPHRFQWSSRPRNHVCFMGRFARVKGLHTAIDVAEKAGLRIAVAGEIHPVDHAFGESEVLPRLEKPHVDFMGCLDTSRKVPLLRDARALLAPIEWEEPFGLILIEAMLSGCPVVAFPRGSVPELVEPGVTGFIADSAEEMSEIIKLGGVLDSFDRHQCRQRAVERFSRARLVSDHEQFYAKAINQHTPRFITNPLLRPMHG
jgi:glycosyltransferase involved in cell wall biosynthesis